MKTTALFVAFLLAAAPLWASDAITAKKYFVDDHAPTHDVRYMTGDWQNTRTTLAGKGVTFDSSFVCDILGNTTGGRGQGARYDHSMGWDINFDLEKFVGLIGTQFHVSGLWRSGQNLSKAVIGNALVCSSIFGSEQFRFYGLYLDQTLFNKRFNLRVGRIAAGDDFASSPLYWNFVSNGIDGNPITIPINMFFTAYPTAVWGARAKILLTDEIQWMSAIYNGDDRVQRLSAYGLDFTLKLERGIAMAHELKYMPKIKIDGKTLPGNYKGGIFYTGATTHDLYADINGGSASVTGLPYRKHIGNYAVYLHADQMIYKEKEGGDQGLTALVVGAISQDNLTQFPYFVMGGLLYEGLIPGRDTDITGVQFMYAKWSHALAESEGDTGIGNTRSQEIVFEITHKVMITHWMYLQPDLQYIINPGGRDNYNDALVIGTRFGLIF